MKKVKVIVCGSIFFQVVVFGYINCIGINDFYLVGMAYIDGREYQIQFIGVELLFVFYVILGNFYIVFFFFYV